MLNDSELLGKVRKWVLEGRQKLPCTAVVLYNAHDSGRLDAIDEWDPQREGETPETIALAISTTANEDAKQGKGEQSYTVGFFFGEGANQKKGGNFGARFRFSIEAPSFENDGEGPLIDAQIRGTSRETGTLATSYARDLAKLTIPWANSLLQAQQNTIMRLEAQVNELMAERRRNVILHEKLSSQAFKRQIMLRKVVFWEKQKEEVASIIFPMLAPLLGALAGRPMLPSSPTEETRSFEDFAKGLTDEQLAQLQMKLRPHQLPAVFQIVQAVKTKQTIPNVVLREFVKSIDEAQMEDFKEVLTGEQHHQLISIVVSYMQKYQQMQEEAKSAYAEADDPQADEEPNPLDENAPFD